ncbi:uncharacterized protein TNCV_801161 [Trichonephila clavipes]|uniref:Uncharacterized protein n=1 Tax=Trichonephila clavipes TaxID=2585209 RepID=A0A8X6R2I5_TRICX|nr:uncharacterized protein TNCV_801161 [Trichonephila clavipes]
MSVHSEVRKVYEAPTDVPIVDISISFDASCLTHGHTSSIGIACVIDILTGYVIDFEVMSFRPTKNLSIRNVQSVLTRGVFTSPQKQKDKNQVCINNKLGLQSMEVFFHTHPFYLSTTFFE